MQLSTAKTKSMVISKLPVRCKLVVDNLPIEQALEFSYLGTTITSYQSRTEEIQHQINKANRIVGALRQIILNNKYMSIERPNIQNMHKTSHDLRRRKPSRQQQIKEPTTNN